MDQKKEKFSEGGIKECAEIGCNIEKCCRNNTAYAWLVEYFMFQEKMKDILISHRVNIKFENDRVVYDNCVEGNECKFVKYSPFEDVDPRPLDCKLYPYHVDWNSIDFNRKTIILYLVNKDCPLVRGDMSIKFKEEIEKITKRDFAKFFGGAEFKVEFFDEG